MKRAFVIFVWLAITNISFAQSTNISTLFLNSFKKAELFYSQRAYRNAVDHYLAAIRQDSSNSVAKQNLADCYYRLGKFKESEKWYGALVKKQDPSHDHIYHYAQLLIINGHYDDASGWYGQLPNGENKIKFIRDLAYYTRDSSLYGVTAAPFNSDQSDFAPQFYKEGAVFVSSRQNFHPIQVQSTDARTEDELMMNVYYSALGSDLPESVIPFYKRTLKSTYHDGPVALYRDGKSLAFTRTLLKNGKPVYHEGKAHLQLFFSDLDNLNLMGTLEPFTFNSETYSIAHPWISNDGNELYFSSDMPGGQGGADIYRVIRQNGKWSAPQNLGPTINTSGNEYYPFVSKDRTLYFSSDGHGGFGGLDIFSANVAKQEVSRPENLGFPLNSSYDDFSFVLNDASRNGMLASNRPGGKGFDDIYQFTIQSFSLVAKVFERGDSTIAIDNALIRVIDQNNILFDSARSAQNGTAYFDLSLDEKFKFKASKEGYTFIDTLSYSTFNKGFGKDTVFIPLWKNALFAKGVVYSNESQKPEEGVTVMLEDLITHKKDSIVTDATGAYSYLVFPEKRYKIRAEREGFIPQEFELNTTGMNKGDLLNDFVLEEEFLEKEVIQFDFDKWDIKPAAYGPLAQALKNMKKYRKRHLHIGAYADSRGTHEYNQALSDKRAKAVVDYFISNGIDPKRITAIGFGEALLVNRCSNGVICPEEEHSKNRRAELKVQINAVK